MKFYSRGKLLFTGEYLVLKGATALTAPLVLGQSLTFKTNNQPGTVQWTSNEKGSNWFRATFKLPFFELVESSDELIALNLLRYFNALKVLNPSIAEAKRGYSFVSDLEFDRSWGFGSSSSLTSNLAYWADVDPFKLHQHVSKGSGYDVVCSREEGPVLFSTDGSGFQTETVDLDPAITDALYFVYLGQKASSDREVSRFLQKGKSFKSEIHQISELSRHIAYAKNIRDVCFYIKEHEQIIASILKMEPLKETLFRDFQGEVKSMGAWGGDFALVAWQEEQKDLKHYLESKNLNTFFSFDALIKSR
jgi:mevalonate kinase